MRKGGRFVAGVFIPLFFGSIMFFNVVSQPRFEAIRSIDVVRLVASGMCLGVALVSIAVFLRGPRNG